MMFPPFSEGCRVLAFRHLITAGTAPGSSSLTTRVTFQVLVRPPPHGRFDHLQLRFDLYNIDPLCNRTTEEIAPDREHLDEHCLVASAQLLASRLLAMPLQGAVDTEVREHRPMSRRAPRLP